MADPTPTASPAYAAAPRRSGLLYAIAGIVALAAVAALAIFMLGGRAPAPVGVPAMPADRGATDAQKSLEAAKAALDAASKSVLNPSPTSPPPEPPAAVVAAGAAATDAAPPAPRIDAAPAATPPRPATVAAAAPPPKAAAPKAAPAQAAMPAAAPVPAASPPTQVASVDRFAQMREEMGRCSSSSVIPRIQCERRIRAHYCDGYWGTVPDCPTSNSRRN